LSTVSAHERAAQTQTRSTKRFFETQIFACSRLVLPGEIAIVANAGTQRNAVSIIPHHKFNKETLDNDIAVVKVGKGTNETIPHMNELPC